MFVFCLIYSSFIIAEPERICVVISGTKTEDNSHRVSETNPKYHGDESHHKKNSYLAVRY